MRLVAIGAKKKGEYFVAAFKYTFSSRPLSSVTGDKKRANILAFKTFFSSGPLSSLTGAKKKGEYFGFQNILLLSSLTPSALA